MCVFVCVCVCLCVSYCACCVVRLVFSVLWMSVFSVLCVSVSDVTDERRGEREEDEKNGSKGTGTRWC